MDLAGKQNCEYDTKLSNFEIAASAFGGLAMTNGRATDLRQFGAYTNCFGISSFFIDSAAPEEGFQDGWNFDPSTALPAPNNGRSLFGTGQVGQALSTALPSSLFYFAGG